MTGEPAHVQRLLGESRLQRLVNQLVQRIEGGRPLLGRMAVRIFDSGERSAIAALMGRSPGSGSTISVDLQLLDRIVRDSGAAASLAEAVHYLRGPLVVRAEFADAQRLAWDEVHAPLDNYLAEHPDAASWAQSIRSRGQLRRLARTPDAARELLERVLGVLEQLPSSGEALPRLAARVLGSAHALDFGTPESALVLSALAEGGVVPPGSQGRREVWARAGIAMDELSSTVLVHRLPLPGALGQLTCTSEPVVITLRQLRRLEISVPTSPVFVCENPSIVDAAARELAADSPPIVCIQGQPSLAAVVLLRAVASAGIRYHGDFDWGGLRIANRVHELFGFEPWRYSASDLDESAHVPGTDLKGSPVDARWDAAIRPALERRGSRLEEEQVIDQLLADLSLGRTFSRGR